MLADSTEASQNYTSTSHLLTGGCGSSQVLLVKHDELILLDGMVNLLQYP